ncbi:hypothetical protein I4U23_008167 [Adineta vaga]|nr:hypothetical protein I4U23_008167 [Adineta vaga]
MVEIHWPDNYPDVIPVINLDLFSNRLLTNEFKTKLKEKLTADANEQLGMPMTYTLFESVKDFSFDGDMFLNSLVSNAFAALPSSTTATTAVNPTSIASTVKKEQLTKSQKRRQWNHRTGGDDGQKARGHDWVDIIRHLSQSGNKIET